MLLYELKTQCRSKYFLVREVFPSGSVGDGVGLGLDKLSAVGQDDLLIHAHIGIDVVQGLSHARGRVDATQRRQEQAR